MGDDQTTITNALDVSSSIRWGVEYWAVDSEQIQWVSSPIQGDARENQVCELDLDGFRDGEGRFVVGRVGWLRFRTSRDFEPDWEIYTDSAQAKIPAVLDYLGTVIEAGCKFLIFAHHQPMIDSIYQFLQVMLVFSVKDMQTRSILIGTTKSQKKKVGCIRIDGSTPAASRQALVTDFQEKDSIKAAVLSIKAGGVGITLTAASTVIFAELSWTPGDIIQAEDRAHRIGQVSSVNVYYLLANDTVDDIIWDVVQSKLENLGQMLDGHERTLEVSGSQPKSSPAKQRALDSFGSQPKSSPAKQTTLDSFVKRCSNMNDFEHRPQLKYPRHGD
ncbi:hypothetical protein C3L33_13073, partial [Rhododendron williamsianum]